MLFGRKKRVQISGNSWGVYTRLTGDNLPFIVRVDTDLAQEKRHKGYDHSARLRLHAQHPLDNGLPARDELPALGELEDRLVELLESKCVRCRLAASLTGGGTRELLFQVQDVAAFRDCVSGLLAGGGERRWELLEDKGWKYFDEAARPPADGWRQIADADVVSQLLKAGSNPEADHRLEFTFLGQWQKLEALKQDLITAGFGELSFDRSQGCLEMTLACKLDIAVILSVTCSLAQAAGRYGVTYDGWGAAIVR